MLYKTLVAMAHLGSRVEADQVLDLTEEQAFNYADAVVVNDEQTKEQLQATAAALGLSTAGSKADLLERISLHNGEGEEVTS
jgi:hypothetical protein